VFEQITKARPPKLYVFADGPNSERDDDEDRCRETRSVINVDWDCEVTREYADLNLGLKQRWVTGFDYLFDHEDRAIILEDDIVASETFFKFCETLLDRYQDDKRIWDINGTNYLKTWKPERQDYHFTYHGSNWGWATWRRCWEEFDPEMELWGRADIRDRIRDVLADRTLFEHSRTVYDRSYQGAIKTWDYPWGFARQLNSGMSIVPAKNLVSNVGFRSDATHTRDAESPIANLQRYDIEFPLSEPDHVAVDRDYDRASFKLRKAWWERQPMLRWLVDEVTRLMR
jgi:GR25 family glycosyltransferase involved in LPS biosynthesis